MSAPPKPWERSIGVNQRQSSFLPDQTNNFQSSLMSNINGGGGGGPHQAVAPPPLPPAPNSSSINRINNYPMSSPAYSSYGSYGGGYGAYGATSAYGGGYGSFGGYNRFGMGGMGMPPHPIDNGFIQLAEESSRPAFQSIESIVHAFGSVSMMLESTYHAVHSSFRAVLGVAEHFTRMKSQFAQIFSALAVVRTLKWLYRKLLYLIGLRMQNPRMEDVWRSAAAGGSAASSLSGEITEADLKASKSSWPILMFFAVVFGGPYLIWRLLSTITPAAAAKSKSWLTGQGEHYAATAAYDFKGRSASELSFQRGQPLILAPKDQQPSVRGWLLASDGKRSGLVPANYIKIGGLRKPKEANSVADAGYSGQKLEENSSTEVVRAHLPVDVLRPEGRLVAPGIPGIPRVGHAQPSGSSQPPQQTLSSQPPSTQPSTTQPTTISSSINSDTLLTNSINHSELRNLVPQSNTSQISITPNTTDVDLASKVLQTTTSQGSVPNKSSPIFNTSYPSNSPEGSEALIANSISWDFGLNSNDGNDNTTPLLSKDEATELGSIPSGINTNGQSN